MQKTTLRAYTGPHLTLIEVDGSFTAEVNEKKKLTPGNSSRRVLVIVSREEKIPLQQGLTMLSF